ncbi:MAG: hypothetical protein KGJ85_00065 [Betaproteobacteria bacterium]|nr:hypothetical protein [Betaproteobacteria bacterium]
MLGNVGTVSGACAKITIFNSGYRGAAKDGMRVLHSVHKRGLARTLHAMLKRRSAVKPGVGHMNTDGSTGAQTGQGGPERRVACGDVRRRSRHPPAAEETAASCIRIRADVLAWVASRDGLNP